jgi:hypothetical protein
MLAQQIETATRTASLSQLDHLSKQAWSAWGEGHLTDTDAEAVTAAIEARRGAIRQRTYQNGSSRPRMLSKRPSSPDRRKSITRRRKNASSGVIPANLACHFTQGEVSALTVVAREVKRKKGRCELPLDAIAAMAGVCRTVVKSALREAQRLRLVNVTERPRPGRRSDTNLITIVSPEWRTWLKIGRDRGQKTRTHGIHRFNTSGTVDDKPRRSLSVLVDSEPLILPTKQHSIEGRNNP